MIRERGNEEFMGEGMGCDVNEALKGGGDSGGKDVHKG